MKLHNLARRARRGGLVLLVAGAGAFGIAAPAVAAPAAPAPTEERCSDPLDGVTVCYTLTKGETPSDTTVTASVRAEEGRTLKGALVVVEACSADCQSVQVATGQDVREISATQPYGKGTGYYRANGSWVDDQQHVHTGVIVD